MKILVTGARGFVGARIMEELGQDAVPAPSLRAVDEEGIRRIVDAAQAELIIHTAAMSDISTCEKDPDGSYYANVEIPIWLARTGIKCVMFSTDQVYSGCAGEGPYTVDIQPETILLRATWMYDMPKYGVMNRGNFLINMLRQSEISFSFAQHRAVTYVREVAGLIRQAALLPGGAYNYGSENDLTMFETAEWLRQTLSLPIKMQDTGPRHNLWMDCSKIRNRGIHFSDTVEGLQKCIRDYSL